MLSKRRPPLKTQRDVRDAPAVVFCTDSIAHGDARIVEKHLAEVTLTVDRSHGPDFDAGLVHIKDEPGNSLVFRCIRIGAYQKLTVVSNVRARAPNFLPIHDVLVAFSHRPRAQ